MQVPTLGPRFHPRNRVGAAKPVPAEERTLDSLSGRCTIAVELAPTNLRCSTRCPCGHECRQENRGGTSLRCALQRRDEWAPKLPPVAVTPPARFRSCQVARSAHAPLRACGRRSSPPRGNAGHPPATVKRNERSRSAGTAGHVQTESVVTLARNTHPIQPTSRNACADPHSGSKNTQPSRVPFPGAGPRKWSGSLRFCNSR